jgi:hypothetical protein
LSWFPQRGETQEDPEDPTEVGQNVGLSRNPVDPSTDKRRSSISIDVG